MAHDCTCIYHYKLSFKNYFCSIPYVLICCVFNFHLVQELFNFHFDFFIEPMVVQECFVYFLYVYSFFPAFLMLIFSFIPLWSEKIFGVISNFLNLLDLFCGLSYDLSLGMFHVDLRRMYVLLLLIRMFNICLLGPFDVKYGSSPTFSCYIFLSG